ncbi:histidine phosphatase family protein [Vibrio panuliri]|uniref:Alpha-ribazole phosphatase n=1 Tax=Vibrio panuliri TaxID=1381081 RepID=A0ABX3FEM9_9VIBR|nr:histidine phosphatase family protein [Vibrio panuliri]KAB1454476.1 alpha-ribazole phosphatase [Vibrio panuliri]OLQ90014.1 alpha-ribazole phosphatase [Vibrio panuliri]
MRSVNFYLLRHGKVSGEPALYGHTDVLVDEQTQQSICQALIDAEFTFDAIVASPLRRCADLASLLEKANPQWQVSYNQQLKEISFGLFDGIPFTELKEQWSVLDAFWQQPAEHPLPQAETLEDFYTRVSQQWSKLVACAQSDTLIICHGGTIRMILAYVLGLDWANARLFSVMQIGNQSLTHIKVTISDSIYPQVCSIGTPLITA